MTPGQTELTLQEMIQKGPEWLDAYLRPFERGAPAPASMLGIEAGANSMAHSEQSLEWAQIAIRAAALYALENGGRHRASALWKAMALRAGFISKMGSRPGHPVLDAADILRWFETETEFPLDVVRQKAAQWKTAPPAPTEDLIKLRNIKGRIRILKMLADAGELPAEPRWQEWLEISAQIP